MYDVTDLELPHAQRDPQLAELRATAGIPHDDRHDLWYVGRHADVTTVAHDPATYSSARGVTYFDAAPLSFVTMDDPEHGRLRRIVSRQFTPKMVKGLRDQTGAYTEAALDGIDDPTDVDIVSAVAAPVTLRVIADMLGLPSDDLHDVKQWTDAMMDAGGRLEEPGAVESATEGFAAWTAYVDEQVERRLAAPGPDLLSALAHADDERLGRDELAMFATTLMVAGNETTRHTSTRGLEVLIAHPDQKRRLAIDPALLPTAVEEILRWTSVTRHMLRTVTTDTELAGTTLAAGTRVILLYPSANRDETVFTNPADFDIERAPNPHLAFGIGTHYCIGANLARMEIDVIIGAVLSRWPDLVQVPGTTAVHRANGLVAGVAEMRLDLTGAAA